MTLQPRQAALAAQGSKVREALLSQRPLYVRALRYSLVIGMLMLLPSWFMFEVYGRVLNSRSHTTLWMLVGMMAVGLLLMELFEYVRGRLLQAAGLAVEDRLRHQVFDSIFAANLLRSPGGTIQSITDLKTLREFLPSPAVGAMLDIPAALLMLVIMFLISPWLGIMTAIGALLQTAIAYSTERRTMPLLNQATRKAIEAQQYAANALRNGQVIQAMGMTADIYKRWSSRHRAFLAFQTEASDAAGLNAVGAKLIQTAQGSLLLGAACWLALHNNLWGGVGMAMMASIIGARALAPMALLVAQWRVLVGARDAARRIDVLLAAIEVSKPGMRLPPPKGYLSVEQLTAGAPGVNLGPILKGVTFFAKPGEMLAILGPSASGKTSLARLLVGVWAPSSGKVRLDGADVFQWDKGDLGPHVGYLSQGVELFDGTVGENIARFGDVNTELMRSAAAQVGLTAAIEALEAGFDTRIGEDGSTLSGGQRQRLALARAIYGNPQLLVLDEPNASLDAEGDAFVLSLLAAHKARGATVVVITHRTNLLPLADQLLILADGRTAMFGPRDEVLTALRKTAEQTRAQANAQRAAAQSATTSPGQQSGAPR